MKEELTVEDEKALKRKKKCQKVYNEIASELSLTGNAIDDMHKLVAKGQELQAQICKSADSIKIDDYEKANELSPIDQKTYNEFVSIAAKKMEDKLNEKAISKFEDEFNHMLFITNAKRTFLDTYMAGEDLKLADDEDTAYEPFEEHKSDEFQKILENSAMTRNYINKTLYSQMKALGMAAEYITNGKVTYKEFKMINDFEYYVNGGYPKPTTPAKLWSIFEKFSTAYRLMHDYQFNQIDDLSYEFGLGIELGDMHQVNHPWINTIDEID